MVAAAVLAAAAAHLSPTPSLRPPVSPAGAETAESVADDLAAPAPSPEAGRLPAGVHVRVVHLDGQRRRWTTVVPESGGRAANGVVVVLHGVGGRGPDMRATAGLDARAAAAGVVTVYPDGFAGAWNDGRPGADPVTPGEPVDDVAFLRLVVDETVARTGAAPGRVAVVGFSAGAVMAGRMGCEAADRIVAVALVAGSAGQGFEGGCRPVRPVAAMVVAGSADTIVPYSGGRVADWAGRRRGFVAPVEDFFAFWAAQGGCTSTLPASPSPQVSELRAADCQPGGAALRYRVGGGSHEWFRSPRFDTSEAVWRFVAGQLAAA